MDERRKLLYGEFGPTARDKALYDRIEKYYRDTPESMDNGDAYRQWKECKRWCHDHGYTDEEIRLTKRFVEQLAG